MNQFFERHWLAWSVASALGLLLMGTRVWGADGVPPRSTWMEIGPQELQRDNLGSIFAGPMLEPGPHMVWVAAKENRTELPYTTWRSFGPFDVVAGHKYLVTLRGNGMPVITWKTWDTRLGDEISLNSLASVYYLNLNESDEVHGIIVVPAVGTAPQVVSTGVLAADDPKEARYQCPCHVHPVVLAQGKTYVIEMRSTEFDTYLMLEDGAGSLLAQNDDTGTVLTNDALNSRITIQPKTTGLYRVIASAFAPSGAGNYTMSVREIPVMMRVEDELTAADESRNDSYAKSYDVALTAGHRYYIDLDSNAFATYLRVLNPAGLVVSVDEGGGSGMNTRVEFQAVTTGVYRIVATSFEERNLGPFTLTVREEE